MMEYTAKLHVGWRKYYMVTEAETRKEAARKVAIALTSNYVKTQNFMGEDVNIKSSEVKKFTL